MRKILMLKLSAVFLLVTTLVSAQQQKSTIVDSLSAYREFVSLGKWYLNMPLQFRVHFVNHTTPLVRQQDNMESDILLYYGRNDFYMQAGAIEQIVNDSLTVLVNNEVKSIKIYSNTNTLTKSMERIIPGLVPDSSLQNLSRQYSIVIEESGKDLKKMIVQSRNKISGTASCKEMIAITYQPGSHQPINYVRTQRSLVPVDSAIYTQMKDDQAYAGRMISTKTKKGELFFVMKEKITECSFAEVNYSPQQPPAFQQDRIVRTQVGEYLPAKGFEDYLVSKEF